MKTLPSLNANAPLLVGTVRSVENNDNLDGDIVLTKVNVNGVDRVKIYQREHQNGFVKLLFRTYDTFAGNVNCTQHLERIDEASGQPRSPAVTHQRLASTLKNIRTRLEQSETPQAEKDSLAKTLVDAELLQGPSEPSNVELGEPQWSPDDLIAILTAAGSRNQMSKESLAWLADIRTDPKRVFTHHERVRINQLADLALKTWNDYAPANESPPDGAKKIWLAHAKKNNLPEGGKISMIVRRELHRLKDHAARRCIHQVQGNFLKRLQDLITAPAWGPSLRELQTVCLFLEHPDFPLLLADTESICSGLAYLRSQWDALKGDKAVLLELEPLLFKAKRVYAQEMKNPEQAAVLQRSVLKPWMLDQMLEDIRRSHSAPA